jgi:hypothetical protein
MSAVSTEDEGFFRRWARRKSQVAEGAVMEEPVAPVAAPAAAPAPAPAPAQQPLGQERESARSAPTLEDVARLTQESDYSAFVARGVDKTVQRMALKKLFADPHFNVMDGLDIYIDDYNKVTPLSAEMLASLKHAPGVLSQLFGDDKERDGQAEEGAGAKEPEMALEQAPPQSPEEERDPDGTTPPPPQQGNP